MSFRAVASVDFFAMMTKFGFECVDSQKKTCRFFILEGNYILIFHDSWDFDII